MQNQSPEEIKDLIGQQKFGDAVEAVNNRYRVLGLSILSVFENFVCILVEPSFIGDLRNAASLIGAGRPSSRTLLKNFLTDSRAKNCLAAVLFDIERNVPSEVGLGMKKCSSFFRDSDYFCTYQTDIVLFEPEFSLLKDDRLSRLLSAPPNVPDLSLLDEELSAKKSEVMECYEKESLKLLQETFYERLGRCSDFFGMMETFSNNFSSFFRQFSGNSFRPDIDTFAEWAALGDDYFQLELTKSSLMLPIVPKALYWGLKDDYPSTLERLKELKNLLTPSFSISDISGEGGDFVVTIERRSLPRHGGDITLEQTLRLSSAPHGAREARRVEILEAEGKDGYRVTISGGEKESPPLHFTLRLSCDSPYYHAPYVLEKIFHFPE